MTVIINRERAILWVSFQWTVENGHFVVPSGGHASSAKLEPMEVAFFVAGEMTQVKESIPWVRCASGNILK